MYSDCSPIEFTIILLVVHCMEQESPSLAYKITISWLQPPAALLTCFLLFSLLAKFILIYCVVAKEVRIVVTLQGSLLLWVSLWLLPPAFDTFIPSLSKITLWKMLCGIIKWKLRETDIHWIETATRIFLTHVCTVSSVKSVNKNFVSMWTKILFQFKQNIVYRVSSAERRILTLILTHVIRAIFFVRCYPESWPSPYRFVCVKFILPYELILPH